MADLIDPFDDPNFSRQATSPAQRGPLPAPPSGNTGLIDPFDDAEFTRQATGPRKIATTASVAPPRAEGTLPGWGMALTQGLTFGFGDELIAGGKAAMGGDYDKELFRERTAYDNYQKENPWTATGLEVAGSLPLALVGGGAATLGAAGRAASLGTRVGRSAVVGAGEGALAGAGNADGDLTDRAKGAVVGGLLGGTIGAAVPTVAAGAGAAGRVLKDAAGVDPNLTANRKILHGMDQDGNKPEDFIAKREFYDYFDPSKPEILADLHPGGSTASQTEVLAHRQGPTRAKARLMMDQRGDNQSGRIVQDLKGVFGDRMNFHARLDDLIKTRSQEAAPLYDQAYAHGPVNDEGIRILLSRLPSQVSTRAKEQLLMDGRDLPQAFIKDADGNLTLNVEHIPDVKFLDTIKKSIDGVIESETDEFGKVSGRGREFIQKKNELLGLMDKAVPVYGEARRAYAGPSSLMDAMKRGQNLFNERAEVTARDVADMSETEKDAFITGVSDALLQKIDKLGDGRDASRSIWGTPERRKQIMEAIKATVRPAKIDDSMTPLEKELELTRPADEAEDLWNRLDFAMDREREMARTRNRLMGGSDTMMRTDAKNQLDAVLPASLEVATGGTGIPTAAAVLGGLLKNAGSGTRRDNLNRAMGDRLLATGPGQEQVLQELIAARQKAQRNAQMQGGLLGTTVGGVYAQAAGRYAPGLLNIPDEEY